MDNIYGQTPFERNSIVELPDGFAKKAGDTLYLWLGSLWRSIHRGDSMVRGLQEARGIRLAQLYLDILEAAKLQDRNGAPVFHRELWHPIFIRRSMQDQAQENMLSIGMDAEIGPQPEGSEYGEGTILKMGRLANFENYVTYPIGKDIVGMSASIVDNIVKPSVSMEYEKDFWFRNDSIIFRKDMDPLGPDSPFERYDVGDDPECQDIECVLWASDVLVDKNYVSDHLSYALGADAPSTDVVKRIVNAAWSSVASGLTPELIKTLVAAMLNIPVIQNDLEVVVSIDDDDGAKVVHTDKGEYHVSPKAVLRRDVFPGAHLVRGSLLDESLRIYPFMNRVSVSDAGDGQVDISYDGPTFSVPVEQDIASVVLPHDILRVRTRYGLYAMWGGSVVKSDGNPEHLYFDVGGDKDDVEAFWSDIWSRAEAQRMHMADIVGEEHSVVSPAAFFLKHLVGANTLFVVVDDSQLDDPSLMHDPMFFGMLSSVVPSAIRLFVIEHRGVKDDADLDNSRENTFLAAALPRIGESVAYSPAPGPEGQDPSFGDHVSARFVRPSPPKVKGRKEEE